MPARDWKFRIEDILEAIEDINTITEYLTYEAFSHDTKTIKAVLYNIAILGEAAKHIPEEIKKQYSLVPWREMGDMRNMVIHEYFGVDIDILWETIRQELPPLVPHLKVILSVLE
jgi:uncharacterized protein with HEPN domain